MQLRASVQSWRRIGEITVNARRFVVIAVVGLLITSCGSARAAGPRTITLTQEVLFIRRGKVRVDIYSDRQVYLESRILGEGDVILLSSGGHGFEALEELEMIEVKQGPYAGGRDKTRFSAPKLAKILLGSEA